jgi:hypothetical protein
MLQACVSLQYALLNAVVGSTDMLPDALFVRILYTLLNSLVGACFFYVFPDLSNTNCTAQVTAARRNNT